MRILTLDGQSIKICLMVPATPPGLARLGAGQRMTVTRWEEWGQGGGAGGGWRVAGPGLSTAGDCQWEEDCSQYPLSRRTRSTRDTWHVTAAATLQWHVSRDTRPPARTLCGVTSVAPAGVLGRGGAALWLFVGLMLMLCTLLPRLHKRLKVSAKFCGSFRTFSMMKAPSSTFTLERHYYKRAFN